MSYALIVDNEVEQYPVSIRSLQKIYPNVSFPSKWELFDYSLYGVVVVEDNPPSSYSDGETSYPAGVVRGPNDTWEVAYVVRYKTAEEIEAEQEAKGAVIRLERDQLLAASDWTQVSDAPVDQTAWSVYRQELRDVTDQPTFPDSVVWPTEPV